MTAIDDGQRREKRRAAASLVFGTLFALAGVLLYVLWDLPKAWEIILPMRLSTAGAFLVAAAAVGCATVVFHTLTHNDILTPSLLGFDALYVLINTLLVFFVGTQALLNTDNLLFFFIIITVMIAFAVAIFVPLLLRPSVGVEVLLLIGVTCGLLIRSITALLQRLLDPQAHMVLADTFFASFESVNSLELGVAAFVVVAAVLGLWMARHHLDVLALGRERAIVLGVRYRRSVFLLVAVIALLVAVATELVGPLMFLGLIVAHLSYTLCGTSKHVWTIPLAAILGCGLLAWGQFFLDRLLNDDTPVSVIIEFCGGALLLYILVSRRRKVA